MFNAENEFYTYNTIKECEATFKFAQDLFGSDKKFFFVGDLMTFEGVKDFVSRNGDYSDGLLNLAELESYKTPGFGCVQQVSPVLGYKFNLKSDSDFSVPRKMAEETIKFIPAKKIQEIKANEEIVIENNN